MGNSFLYGCITVLLLISVAISGCTTGPVSSSGGDTADNTMTDDNSAGVSAESTALPSETPVKMNSVFSADKSAETDAGTSAEETVAAKAESAVNSGVSAVTAADYYMYPDAYEKYDIVYFDPSSGRSFTRYDSYTNSFIELGDLKTTKLYPVVDMKKGRTVTENADSGRKFVMLAVKMALEGDTIETFMSPSASDFTVIDGSETYEAKLNICPPMGAVIKNSQAEDEELVGSYVLEDLGDIYVGQTIYGKLHNMSVAGERTGWLVFDVPESFKLNKDTYLKMKVGDSGEAYWHLSYLRADVSVKKSPSTGNIEVFFKGGTDENVVGGIEIVVTKPDGTVNTELRKIEADEYHIPVGTKVSAEASEPGAGTDHVVVYLIRMDGEKFVKYEEDLSIDSSR
ncbi:hypothetical protein [Methanoplanus endosymbiosus]|uniref:Uncharacterized protein n=1 Tax=Methanoplanus endosymbiosus TaxID=33865 RepID=A0A9E7PKQ5_9EURY|nr:hypothetical protein [Methanoplanus endosymbiosus]UUX91878.1 hypothetical protein L6E24_10975 [Methanoplanus endosymbiosus]